MWLRERTEVVVNQLWRSVNYPAGHHERGTLPVDRDRRWYIENVLKRTGLDDRGAEDSIFDLLPTINLYDVIAVVAAIEPQYFASFVRGWQPTVDVVGFARDIPGVPNSVELTARTLELLRVGFAQS